jgi:hypothetical protein
MIGEHMPNKHTTPPFRARMIHRFSVPIILAWLAITVILVSGVPSLEQVEKERVVSTHPTDAPSYKAAKRMLEDFKESNSGNAAIVVLEGQHPLGNEAHRYYDHLIRQLEADPKHVRHIQNFWGDPLTAGAAQSADGVRSIGPRGRPRPGVWQRIGRSCPEHRDSDACAARGEGICHGPGGDRCGHGPQWRQDSNHNDGGEPRRDLHDVVFGLPFG